MKDLCQGAHGGRRPGSGRKRIHSKGVAHRIREKVKGRRVIHFSLQHSHVHLIVEAIDNKILSSGMRSLTVTMGRGIGKGIRFHLHVLRTVKETRNTVHYVLFNQQKHSSDKIPRIDGFSSPLAHPEALELIKNNAEVRKITLILGQAGDFSYLCRPNSYLYNLTARPSPH